MVHDRQRCSKRRELLESVRGQSVICDERWKEN